MHTQKICKSDESCRVDKNEKKNCNIGAMRDEKSKVKFVKEKT